jgi:hypothetical protein
MTDANDGTPTFDRDIKPLFREGDRKSTYSSAGSKGARSLRTMTDLLLR